MKKAIVAMLILIVGFYLILFRGLFVKGRLLDNHLKAKTKEIATYRDTLKGLPMIDITPILIERKTELNRIYRDYITHLEIHSERGEALSNIDRPALYFKEELHKVYKELKQESEGIGVKIPPTLGFDERVPKDDEVPELVARLSIAEVLVKSAIANKIIELTGIEFLSEPNTNPQSLFREIPIKLGLNSGIESVIKFLDSIQEHGQFFALKDIKIESNAQGRLTADILVSGIVFK